MTVEDMIKKKKELGYSNKKISELSGVPLPTVEKIFARKTLSPRFETIKSLEKVLSDDSGNTNILSKYDVSEFEFDMGRHTVDEYFQLPKDKRVELIDGFYYDMASPLADHQYISALIHSSLMTYVALNNSKCMPLASPIDVILDNDNKTVVQPDILVICDANKLNDKRIYGAPDFVIEILSPINWYMDINIKLNKYRKADVREYWIIIPDKKNIMVFEFEKEGFDGNYKLYTFKDEVPVGIWDGKCTIDFKMINKWMEMFF